MTLFSALARIAHVFNNTIDASSILEVYEYPSVFKIDATIYESFEFI